jgi:glyoxylase-like metal-dependent hydrolase (beta-lactamase superfamily II)
MSELERQSELVWRLLAPNPGPMTLTGTNSYLVGKGGELVAIDPGPLLEEHLQELVSTAAQLNSQIVKILVTHGHPDHFPGAARLKELTGAPVVAYSNATFDHDENLQDSQKYLVAGVTFSCLFTPGHAVDHLCFYLEEEKALFTGDNVLGFGTTIVAPPKGNMRDYLNSLKLLQSRYPEALVIYGGHGPAITDPAAKLTEYLAHRQMRLDKVLGALGTGAQTIPQIVSQVYQDVDRRIWPAAARQVLAQLQYLEENGQVVSAEGSPPTPEETAILYPEGIVDPVAIAELGITSGSDEPLLVYTLTK